MRSATKTYSALDCGCYYSEATNGKWVYCERHNSWLPEKAKQKRATSLLNSWRKKLHIAADPVIRNYSLYALELMGGKYYVGLTARKDVSRRIRQHGGRRGARWTAKHPPIKVVEVRVLGRMPKIRAENLENDMAHEYMDRYGMQNVRGGRMVRTGFLFLRTYNPGTKKELMQVLFLVTVILVVVVVSFLMMLHTAP
jgi:predicted GIY-YIG superfamily endonuclease